MMDVTKHGRNPRCGDDVEVGIRRSDDGLLSVRFRGRGCSVCLASASMMSESISGINEQQTSKLVKEFLYWFNNNTTSSPPNTVLTALDSLRQYPARKKCVLLAWNALNEILNHIDGQEK